MSLPAMLEQTQADENARTLPRKSLRLSVPALVPTGARHAVVHDISVGGLLLETDSPMTTGEPIAIELPGAEQVEARVVWSSGRFYGCAFNRAIPSGLVSASLLKSEPLPRGDAGPDTPETSNPAGDLDDARSERGGLSTAARIQSVVAMSLFLWTLIAASISLLVV